MCWFTMFITAVCVQNVETYFPWILPHTNYKVHYCQSQPILAVKRLFPWIKGGKAWDHPQP